MIPGEREIYTYVVSIKITSRGEKKARYKCYRENIQHPTEDADEDWQCSHSK